MADQDEKIIELYFARDEEAIRATDKVYGNFCTSLAMNILHNKPDAEECVSDTYIKVWQTIPPKRPPSLKTYLAHITRNLAISRYRKRHAKRRGAGLEIPLSELEECLPAVEQNTELKEILNDFVVRLPELDRKLFVGRYWYAYDLSVLSKAYGLAPNTIAQRLYRMREKLRVILTEGGYSV
ncbi:MAG: sigma-70 family RNA polymerase sigma factor [Clostridia bacterium]|nr:sigma-70 family RNA polymerase sigma factor [Clostridia bacterium]